MACCKWARVGDVIVRGSMGLQTADDPIADPDQALRGPTLQGRVAPLAHRLMRRTCASSRQCCPRVSADSVGLRMVRVGMERTEVLATEGASCHSIGQSILKYPPRHSAWRPTADHGLGSDEPKRDPRGALLGGSIGLGLLRGCGGLACAVQAADQGER